jgi:hypothetical protein
LCKLSQRKKWIYGSGDLGFGLTSMIIGAYFAIFLTDVVGVKPALAAVAVDNPRTPEFARHMGASICKRCQVYRKWLDESQSLS